MDEQRIARAMIESRFYVNGSAHWLVVKLADGGELRVEHSARFDAFATIDRIRKATASPSAQRGG